MTDLRGARVLVTGAAGFVGANLARALLEQGARVHGLVRPTTGLWRLEEILPDLTLHKANVADGAALRELVRKIEPEIVFHLAAERGDSTHEGRRAVVETSVLGTFLLLEAMAESGRGRMVFLGSSMEYGASEHALEESACPSPGTLFGAAKAGATVLCQQFARGALCQVVILRVFMAYGAWDKPDRLIPAAVRAALNGAEIALTEGGYRRDWVYIEDVVGACVLAARADGASGEIINIGSGRQWANEEIVAAIGSIVGEPVRVRVGAHPARSWDRTSWVADVRKAKQRLGWEPRHSLHSGLEKTVAWFRRHPEACGVVS